MQIIAPTAEYEKRAKSQSSSLSEPQEWLLAALLGGNTATSGVTVTPDSAMRLAAVFACVRILMEDIASLPLDIYRIGENDAREKARAHPLFDILRIEPNDEMEAMPFWQSLIFAMALSPGTAYAEIVRDGRGNVVALYPLTGSGLHVTPKRLPADIDARQPIVYEVNVPGTVSVILPREKVLAIPGLTSNGLTGLPVVNYARDVFGLTEAMEQFGARYFAEGGHVKDVLEYPEKLSQEAADQLRAKWQEGHGSLSVSQRTFIAAEGMKYIATLIDLTKVMPADLRAEQTAQVARLFRIPLHKLGVSDGAPRANVEHMGIEYVTGTLRPWLTRIEQAVTRQLLRRAERASYYAEYNVEALQRGDYLTSMQGHAIGIQNGFLAPNEVRKLQNLPPYEGGDIPARPMNMVPAEMLVPWFEAMLKAKVGAGSPTPAGSGDNGLRANPAPLLTDLAERLHRRAEADILRQAGKRAMQDGDALAEWRCAYLTGEDYPTWTARAISLLLESFGTVHHAARAQSAAMQWCEECRDDLPPVDRLVEIITDSVGGDV